MENYLLYQLKNYFAIKKYAYEINQIYKKARLDSFKDPHTVNGLKRSEISLRFSEAGELTHKIADSLGEVITA